MLAVKRKLDVGDTSVGDLGTLISGWSNKLAQAKIDREADRLKTVDQQLQFLSPAFPIWDYAIRTFEMKLAGYVKPQGRRVTSDYVSLPPKETLCRGWLPETGWSVLSNNVCEITLGTNVDWICNCTIAMAERMSISGGFPPELRLESKSKWKTESELLRIIVHNGNVYASGTGRGAIPIC